jgi:hypothetical protein
MRRRRRPAENHGCILGMPCTGNLLGLVLEAREAHGAFGLQLS